MSSKELVLDSLADFEILTVNKQRFDAVSINSGRHDTKITLCKKHKGILFIKHPNHPVNREQRISGRLYWMINWVWKNSNLDFLLVYSNVLTQEIMNETFLLSRFTCAGREEPYRFRLKKVPFNVKNKT